MKKIGLFKALLLSSSYKKLNTNERKKLQLRRLQEIVRYAKSNSPYYASLYKNIPDDFSLSDLPPVTKRELMAHWDDWSTDRSVTLADIQTYMEDLDHIGRKWHNKYLVFTTSGSTGHPLIALCDKTTNNVSTAISISRSYARKQDLHTFIRKGGKTIGIFADGGFYLSNSSVRSTTLSMPWKRKKLAITSALLPTSEIVAQLNAFQPTMLGGYPSNLELLIPEQENGNLHISPTIIMTGGEYLSDALRERLSKAFNCYVQTSYCCTEGGPIACECEKQHFHLNDDWVIIEPVDQFNQPVPAGVRADKLLLTNLYNFTQPFIRYEITDRITLHDEPCACGNPSPYITLEGRNDDVISFKENGKVIQVPPLAIYATLKEIHCLIRFQVVAHPNNHLELRLEPLPNVLLEDAYQKASDTLMTFLNQYDIHNVTLSLSTKQPQQHPISGKFKHIINQQTPIE